MLALCGFERYSLHRVGRHEQWLLFTLIVLCFFVTNAYEAKFISLMIGKPSAEAAESFQDLVNQGLEIEIDVRSQEDMPKHKVLGPLIVHNERTPMKLNSSRGYLLESQVAETLMGLSVNYNFDRQRPNYVTLRETLGMRISFYWMPHRSPLVELLRFAQRNFFEAGLLNKWKKIHSSTVFTEGEDCERNELCRKRNTLKFMDFVPLWLMYAIGLTVSGVVFFVEIVLQWNR